MFGPLVPSYGCIGPGVGEVLVRCHWRVGLQAPSQIHERWQSFTDQDVALDFPLDLLADINVKFLPNFFRQGNLKLRRDS